MIKKYIIVKYSIAGKNMEKNVQFSLKINVCPV